jgi:hypothetical protein
MIKDGRMAAAATVKISIPATIRRFFLKNLSTCFP